MRALRTRAAGMCLVAVLVMLSGTAEAAGQLWLDVIASSSQPPVGPLSSPSMYAMFGGRFHTTNKGLEIDGSAYAGTGTNANDGQWISASAGASRKWHVQGTTIEAGVNG